MIDTSLKIDRGGVFVYDVKGCVIFLIKLSFISSYVINVQWIFVIRYVKEQTVYFNFYL